METLSSLGHWDGHLNRPYLLGKSIEWKREPSHHQLLGFVESPYLLGKSIEWKPHTLDDGLYWELVPTC